MGNEYGDQQSVEVRIRATENRPSASSSAKFPFFHYRGVARIFRGGGMLRQLKGYHASPPRRGQGAKASRTLANFHFLKGLVNESIFQKYQQFFLPKIHNL